MGSPVPVSVIIPCFRSAHTVGRAFESVYRQTRPPAELIFVDDASDDRLSAVIEELRDNAFPSAARIEVLPKNVGVAGARNAGWNLATQPYLAFLDADDAWHPSKLELQMGWMDAHPEVVLSSHAVTRTEFSAYEAVRVKHVKKITPWMLLVSNRFQTSSVVMRRSVGPRFADGKRYGEDYLLWLQIVLAGGEAYYLDVSLARRFKPVYGRAGLSAHLFSMQAGEIDALVRVRREGLLGIHAFVLATIWSLAKFLRRLVVAALPSRD